MPSFKKWQVLDVSQQSSRGGNRKKYECILLGVRSKQDELNDEDKRFGRYLVLYTKGRHKNKYDYVYKQDITAREEAGPTEILLKGRVYFTGSTPTHGNSTYKIQSSTQKKSSSNSSWKSSTSSRNALKRGLDSTHEHSKLDTAQSVSGAIVPSEPKKKKTKRGLHDDRNSPSASEIFENTIFNGLPDTSSLTNNSFDNTNSDAVPKLAVASSMASTTPKKRTVITTKQDVPESIDQDVPESSQSASDKATAIESGIWSTVDDIPDISNTTNPRSSSDSDDSTSDTTNSDVSQKGIQIQYERRFDESDGSNGGTNGSKRTLNVKSLSNTNSDDDSNTNGNVIDQVIEKEEINDSFDIDTNGTNISNTIGNIDSKGTHGGLNVRTTASNGSNDSNGATNSISSSNDSNVSNGSNGNGRTVRQKKEIKKKIIIEDKHRNGADGCNGDTNSSSSNGSNGSNALNGSNGASVANEAVASHYEIMIRRNVEEIKRLSIINTHLVHDAKEANERIQQFEGLRLKLEQQLEDLRSKLEQRAVEDDESKIQLMENVVNQHVTTISERDATIEELKMRHQQREEEIGKEQQNIDKARQNMLKFKTKLDTIFSSYEAEMEELEDKSIKM